MYSRWLKPSPPRSEAAGSKVPSPSPPLATSSGSPGRTRMLSPPRESLSLMSRKNPPPVHLFLISSDRDFSSILHKLRMNNYNILLASKESASGVLCSAATIAWDWNALARGENVTAKHFNQPPDGPYHSWYGHYKVPLLDPFAITEKSSCAETEELSESNSNSSSDSTARSVPKKVVEQIRMILLSSYPKGTSIAELRAELIKSNAPMDKGFYVYRKFFRLLLSMPDIFKVYKVGDGQYFVSGIMRKTPIQLSPGSGLAAANEQNVAEKETHKAASLKLNNEALVADLAVEARRDDTLGKMQQNFTDIDKHAKEEGQELEKSSQEPVPVSGQCVEVMDGSMTKDDKATMVGDSEKGGLAQTLKRLWFGSSETESMHPLEIKHVSGDGLEDKGVVDMGKIKDKGLKPFNQEVDPMSRSSPSTSVGSAMEVKASGSVGNEKSMSPGFFNRFRKWLKSWGGNTTTAELNHEARGTQELVDVSSQAHEIFAKDSLWGDVEYFINSPRGYTIVTHSRTREALARNLQKEGPSCLKPLSESNMINFIDLLISEKKWIEQNPADSLPFRVAKKGSSLSHSHAANGLRFLFLDSSKSLSQEQDCEQMPKNVAHAGVSVTTPVDRKLPERSRSDVLADCQKLVKKIIVENPGGYKMGSFRKDFLEEFGYHLDVRKLGYEKLQSLIQVLPGARIESGLIVPSTTPPDGRPYRKCRKDDESDLSFDELGPVSGANTSRKLSEYEPSLSGDSDSDPETEAAMKEKDEQKKKQDMRGEEKDSSLTQILDLWHNRKEGDDDKNKEKPETMYKTKLVRVGRGSGSKKQKPTTTYSFVEDSDGNIDKEKLVDGILGSLKKKLGESRI
ncbi:PREDICTED: uncharacterized protein LOC104799402 isoform X2 [Tarenaya hassleriana]|uniref:uncharacterized protein LOC104799402 isoform X2 n=1 Tax=Tarenaya hassleriana TaxID=28532 RepID=UPI0008FD44E0|nr:PREDICTED: uncharacterized protein LOC104799402 isoform X2 [Tarenaya hassleriana]